MVQEPLPALPTSLAGNLMGMISAYGVHVQNMCDVDGREVLLEVLSIGLKWSHMDLQIGQRVTPTWLAHRLNAHFQDDEEKIGFLCLRSHLWVEGKRSGPVRGGTNGPVDEDVHGLLFANPEAHASALYDVEETTGPLGPARPAERLIRGAEVAHAKDCTLPTQDGDAANSRREWWV